MHVLGPKERPELIKGGCKLHVLRGAFVRVVERLPLRVGHRWKDAEDRLPHDDGKSRVEQAYPRPDADERSHKHGNGDEPSARVARESDVGSRRRRSYHPRVSASLDAAQ